MKKLLGMLFASMMVFSLAMPLAANAATPETTTKTAKTQKTKSAKKTHKTSKSAVKPAAKTN